MVLEQLKTVTIFISSDSLFEKTRPLPDFATAASYLTEHYSQSPSYTDNYVIHCNGPKHCNKDTALPTQLHTTSAVRSLLTAVMLGGTHQFISLSILCASSITHIPPSL